jgi:acyl dehydratase
MIFPDKHLCSLFVLDKVACRFCVGIFVWLKSFLNAHVHTTLTIDLPAKQGSMASHSVGFASGQQSLLSAVGRTYSSSWLPVTQCQIDAFATATGDRQWIHQDNPKAADGPFKGPIAHGLLLLSLAVNIACDSDALPSAALVLYGFDNLRFRAPVLSGARIRCHTTIREVRELPRRVLVSVRLVIEIEDQRIPALVADCLLLSLPSSAILRIDSSERQCRSAL